MGNYNAEKNYKEKNRSLKKAKRSNTPYQWEKFRKVRNKCNTAVENAKTDYYKKLSDKIMNEPVNSKNWSEMVKSLFGRQHKEIPLLKVNDEIIDDREKMADIFNVYFSDQSNIDDSNVQLPDLEKFTSELSTIEITEKDVEDILLNLDTSKAIGPDCLEQHYTLTIFSHQQ
ncbi:unnamed protein product [Mytilus coruscus]|uniref:Reverse transcriptase domain-containing protein n=1 Tax=Mytilus coruscus TaxID=42192 RepID=A0A6J8C5I0_MYTCO|nr:unnamed protein product [Mytilus coruscus]